MTGNPCWQAIPTKLGEAQFEEFVLPYLSRGRRGPPPTLPLQRIVNYVLQALYMGCQWKRVFAWEDKFRRLLPRFERVSEVHYALKSARLHDDQSAALLP